MDPTVPAKAAMGFFETARKVASTVAATSAIKDRDEIISFVRQAEAIYDEKLAGDRIRRELEEALRFKESVHFERNAVWADGDPHPFCSACWEKDRNAVHLTQSDYDPHQYLCPVCKVPVDTDARSKQIHAATMRAQNDALSEARQRRHREQYGDD
jgi:hypothetical protein